MATLSDIKIKQLTATGAVSTNNTAGILYQVVVCGSAIGDKVDIKDGTTTRVTLLTNGEGVELFDPPKGQEPLFKTDIDCTITASSSVYATFLYREIS